MQAGVAHNTQQQREQVMPPGLADTQQQQEHQQQRQVCYDQTQEEALPPGVGDTGQQLEQQPEQQRHHTQQRPWWRGKHSATQQAAGHGHLQQQQQQQQQSFPQTAVLVLGEVSWWSILQLNWRLCVAVFLVYCVTLSIFPGFLAGTHAGFGSGCASRTCVYMWEQGGAPCTTAWLPDTSSPCFCRDKPPHGVFSAGLLTSRVAAALASASAPAAVLQRT